MTDTLSHTENVLTLTMYKAHEQRTSADKLDFNILYSIAFGFEYAGFHTSLVKLIETLCATHWSAGPRKKQK